MKLLVWLLGGVFGIVVMAVLVLSAMSMRPGAGGTHVSIEIPAPPAKIWPWLQDGQKAKQWVGWLVEVRPAGPNKEIWVMQDQKNGGERMEVEGTVLRSDFPRTLTVGLKAQGGFESEQTYTLTDLGNGSTRVDVDARYKMQQMISRLLEPVISSSAQKKLTDDLTRLRTAVTAAP